MALIRLLQRKPDGEIVFREPASGDVPAYAILSHTWEEEEVIFQDMGSSADRSKTKSKAGWKKIQFCAEQASVDGLQYFWIDTCCIDKSNAVELGASINSMFRWYQNAARCYVYLSDVSKSDNRFDGERPWEDSFRTSRWFTRGWTLQELLAPTSVQFFSRDQQKIGDKYSLKRHICAITGIPNAALEGASLSQFTDKERFSWIQYRKTKEEEDKAYALLGIFDVQMLLRYGEGHASACKRLEDEIDKLNQCVRDLRSTDPRDDKRRIQDAKGGLLKDSYRWILYNSEFRQWRTNLQSRLLWIKGDPGKGKTMLLCGIANELETSMAKTDHLSYFFCQATDSRINNATSVLRGLIYLLVNKQPSLISHIQKKYNHAGKSLFEDPNAWFALSQIFTNILQDPCLNETYLIVDALDECIADLPKLLEFIIQQSYSSRAKWIVSSRNWPDIEERLERAGHKVRLCLELNTDSLSTAVSKFIQHKTLQLAHKKAYDRETQNAVFDYLSLNANDTFLWVALVSQNLEATPRWNTSRSLAEFPPGLNPLYERMMEQICKSDNADLCKRILASVAIVLRPVTLKELTALVEMLQDVSDDPKSLRDIVGLCGSFLTIQEDAVYFVHQSVKDFLFAKALNKIFPSGTEEVHFEIFSRSLKAMSRTLRRDMYSLCAFGYPAEQVKQPDPDPLAASRYSCIYWIDHLCNWKPSSSAKHKACLQDGGAVDNFLRQQYLYWLEALSLCKSMSKGVAAMTRLEIFMQARVDAPTLNELIKDARRFIMSHKLAIEKSPLQAYASALLFSPTESLTRGLFKREEPDWIIINPAMDSKWSPCIQTLEGHSSKVNSVAFSHDSVRVASASGDRTVKVWAASSGECLQTLMGHSSEVTSVAFSNDSTRVASVSNETVKVWDVSSGECLQTFIGNSSEVTSVAFSHDSARVVSASGGRTVKVWDASSGECIQMLIGHSDSVTPVAFSHDSTQIASASNETVKVWDVSSGECLQTLKGHNSSINAVAFSHDLVQVASASDDRTVKVWDASSGECLQTLLGHRDSVNSVAFSHNSAQVASASWDRTVKVWDASSGECLQTLVGHSDSVTSVAFSHNSAQVASASWDRTVKVWDASSGECLQTPVGHSSEVTSITFSHDLAQVASASYDRTVKVWDATSSKSIQTLIGHSGRVNSVAFSHDSAWVASASYDRTVKVWDASSGECLQTLVGHSDSVTSVAFSHNSAQVASASWDRTVKVWDSSSGECLQTLIGHISQVTSVAFSHGSTWVASASWDRTVKVWDASSGECLQTLIGHISEVTSVAFSHDSSQVASASDDKTVKVWDASSGECLQTLNVSRTDYYIAFHISGLYLNTDIGTIIISALSGSATLSTISEPCSPYYYGLALSADGVWITFNSEHLVWLPSEYRPSCSAVSTNTISIGVGTGRLWMCKVKCNRSRANLT